MKECLAANGIRHETTVAYTPEQNGVAERYNRTLLECVRVIMTSADIPQELWAEIAATAAYLRNRLPSKANKNKTPYESYHSEKPHIDHLRVIWADAYAHIPKHQRSKLAPRARKLKHIKYHEDKKAYKLWDPEDREIRVSRDVTFDESVVFNHIPAITNDDYDEYLVDSILDERVNIDGSKEYLVKWTGYEETTWEPREHLIDCEALDQWEKQHPESAEVYFYGNIRQRPGDVQ